MDEVNKKRSWTFLLLRYMYLKKIYFFCFSSDGVSEKTQKKCLYFLFRFKVFTSGKKILCVDVDVCLFDC